VRHRPSSRESAGGAAPVDRDDGDVITEPELLAEVDAAFELAASRMARWPNPHLDRPPRDEEYSRLTDPAKWRIVGARADAWIRALVGAGLGRAEPTAPVRWLVPPRTRVSRTDWVVPRAPGALPLVVARSQIGEVTAPA
jgi:hypothetical protein